MQDQEEADRVHLVDKARALQVITPSRHPECAGSNSSAAVAMQAVAQQMADHNETMLAGLHAQSSPVREDTGPADFIARNRQRAGENSRGRSSRFHAPLYVSSVILHTTKLGGARK